MPRRRMTRAEAQTQTRTDLIAAAARVFKRRGYEGSSIAEIAEEAGYTHGAVYSNFDSKEDLFLALYEECLARRVAEIDSTWSEQGPLADRARAAADEWMDRLASEPWPFLLRLELAVRAAHDRDLQQRLATRVGAVPLAIRRLIESSKEESGELPLAPAEVAMAFQALSLGLGLEALSNPAAVRPGLGGELAAFLASALRARSGSETS